MTRTNLPKVSPQAKLQNRLADCADRGVDAINDRLADLDSEWTAGRMVKAIAGMAIVAGFALTAVLDPIWMLLPAVAGLFLLQYIFCRDSVLTSLFGNMGYRSGHEIDEERLLLRTLRGDFRELPTIAEVEDRDAVARLEGEGGPALEAPECRYDAREVAALLASAMH